MKAMMISTRGRYALRALIDLAEHGGDGYIPMKEIANRQGISLKYLEQIVPALSKNGFIEGVHGKGGGYRLAKEPKEYRVGDVLRLTEGDLHKIVKESVNKILSEIDLIPNQSGGMRIADLK